MNIKQEIKCDACNKVDINYTSNCEDWYLQLASVSKAPWYVKEGRRSGAVTSMALEPSIPHTMHFCDLRCLGNWVAAHGGG